jgi:hypothetical protein
MVHHPHAVTKLQRSAALSLTSLIEPRKSALEILCIEGSANLVSAIVELP